MVLKFINLKVRTKENLKQKQKFEDIVNETIDYYKQLNIFNERKYIRRKNESYNEKYILEQESFLNSLNDYEQKILKTYTYLGDGIINNVIRGKIEDGVLILRKIKNFIIHYFNETTNAKKHYISDINFDEFYKVFFGEKGFDIIKKIGLVPFYIREFQKILLKAPKLKENLLVYRGINTERSLYQKHVPGEFLSTSLVKSVANSFSGVECCLLNINIYPGVRTLYIAEKSRFLREREVIVIPPFIFEDKFSEKESFIVNVNITPSVYKMKGGSLLSELMFETDASDTEIDFRGKQYEKYKDKLNAVLNKNYDQVFYQYFVNEEGDTLIQIIMTLKDDYVNYIYFDKYNIKKSDIKKFLMFIKDTLNVSIIFSDFLSENDTVPEENFINYIKNNEDLKKILYISDK